MRRLHLLAIVLIVIGGIGLWLSSRAARPRVPDPSGIGTFPGASVVVVTLDTTRSDRFGCYGSGAGLTPFIDSLAQEGIVFDQAQAVAPVTLPAHASLFTGLFPTNHGVRNNGMFSLADTIETLAEVLSTEGYATGAFISAQVLIRRYGLDQGFAVYDDDLSKGLKIGQTMVPSRRGNFTLDAALGWLRGVEPTQPVFMWLHLYDPHAPYDPPPEYRERFPADVYGAEIAFTDDLVRQLVEELKHNGRWDNTVFTVIADHGEALGEHGEATHGILLHQPTIHVPWVLVTPSRKGPLRVTRPVSGVDLAPTLAHLLEIDPPNADRLDGQSVIAGVVEVAGREREIYSEAMLPMYQYGWSSLRALRKGPWQLTHGARSELFNLARDPRELSDLSENEPMQLEFLTSRLDAIAAADTTLQSDSALDLTPSEREALEALGYAGTTSAPRRDPPDPRDNISGHVQLEQGRTLVAAGRLDEALIRVDAMLSEDPENLSALSMKTQVLLDLGRLDEAEAVARRAMEIDAKASDTIHTLCRIEMQRGQFEKVRELAAIGRTTRAAFGLFDAVDARALIALGRMDEARQLIEAALAQSPDDPDLLSVQAVLNIRGGDLTAAEADLRRAVAADPFHKVVRRQLAQLLLDTNRPDEAASVFEALLALSPGDADSLLAIGSIVLKSDPPRAVPYLEEAARLAPGRATALTTLGIAYIQSNRINEAEAVLRRAVDLKPDEADIRNNLGIVLIQRQQYDEAIRELRAVLEVRPDHYQARNNLAIALGNAGDIEGAEREARAALAQQPDFVDAMLTLASALHQLGQVVEEYQVLQRARSEVPRRPDVVVRLAVAGAASGRCDTALELMPLITNGAAPLPVDASVALATCLEKAGRVREALHHYEEAARVARDGELRDAAKQGIQRMSMLLEEDPGR